MVLKRGLHLESERSYLLLGPRRSGKSTYLRNECVADLYIDLLKSDEFYDYSTRPQLLRERLAGKSWRVIIDEVQRVPSLLTEIHWLIENGSCTFILCGSSARKLREKGVTNLAGRLRTKRMLPFTCQEIGRDFDLLERVHFGCLPPVVFSADPWGELRDYCGEYLREEIQAEGLVRNIPVFNRFLELAAYSNAELLSYSSIARECGVTVKTVGDYFQILDDTLLGVFLEPFRESLKRRAILSRKFYFFDCGVANVLLGRRSLSRKTPEFGKSFEQWLILESFAALHYEGTFERMRFWRSASGYEVDLVIDDHTAVEFKAGNVHPADARSLAALAEELPLKNRWIVCTESMPRELPNGTKVLPWGEYLKRLQAGAFNR